MRLPAFEYHSAANLTDALEKLIQLGSHARVLAGGTDLLLRMKLGIEKGDQLVDISKVRELAFIRKEGSTIRIGALTRFSDIATSGTLKKHLPILSSTAEQIGSWQIRNRATIGGNLCSASPAADSAPALLALDSHVVFVGPDGEAEAPLETFFTGPRTHMLHPAQILKEIVIKLVRGRSAGTYLKLMRKKAADLAMVGVAVQARLNPGEQTLAEMTIGMGGVAATPIRAKRAEEMLKGLSYEKALEILPRAALEAANESKPSGGRIPSDYRRAIVEVYVKRGGKGVLETLFDGGPEK
jgi:CO/xanthine dehydrogenase FAD-binding subunit